MAEFEIYRGSENERFVLGTKGKNTLIVIGINPSIADKETSDRTISRVTTYVQKFGYDSFKMINVYPLRATNFDELPKSFDKKLHEKNLFEIEKEIKDASAILCAWGTHICDREYFKICYKDIFEIISENNIPTYCLGKTKKGHPLHPLLRGIPVPEKLSNFDMMSYIF